MDLLNLSPQVAGDIGPQGVPTDNVRELITKDDLIKLEDSVVSELKSQLEKIHIPFSAREVVKERVPVWAFRAATLGRLPDSIL